MLSSAIVPMPRMSSAVLLALCCLLGHFLCIRSADSRVSRTYLRKHLCPPCASFEHCPYLPPGGCEPVMEPGICSCCLQCAKTEGELCGLKTGRCGLGLTCLPPYDHPDPILSLITGTAMCTRMT